MQHQGAIQERGWKRLGSRLGRGWLFWGAQPAVVPATDPAALSQPSGEVSCLKISWEEVGGYHHGHVAPTPCWPGLSSGLWVTRATEQHWGETHTHTHTQPPLTRQVWRGRRKFHLVQPRRMVDHKSLAFGKEDFSGTPTSWRMAMKAYACISRTLNLNCLDEIAQAQQCPLTRDSKCLFQHRFLP